MLIDKEIKIVREILDLSQQELAEELNVTFEEINRWENNSVNCEYRNIEKIYSYAYQNKIYLNDIFSQFAVEENRDKNNFVLFHGSKNGLIFPIDIEKSKPLNDFGKAFYLGETYNQAAMYIARDKNHSVYCFRLKKDTFKIFSYEVSIEWMLAIAYYRGWLGEYTNSSKVQNEIKKIEESDIVIAPIADNRMFNLIKEFIEGSLNSLQCQHAIAASSLGYQYVIKNNQTAEKLELIKELYIPDVEKDAMIKRSLENFRINQDKVKSARIQYREGGQYIDQLLK